jgi:hypothetical protein
MFKKQSHFLALALVAALIASGAQAASAPTDYFVEANTNGLGSPTTTGAIAGPTASSTDPTTIEYYSPILGFNTVSGTVVETGTASASANLSSGSLHAVAGPTGICCGFSTPPGLSASAALGETLNFSNPGASPTTVTTVDFTVHVDGTSTLAPGLLGGTGSGGFSDINLFVGPNAGNDSLWPIGFSPASPACSAFITTNCVYNSGAINHSWGTSFTSSSNSAVNQDFSGGFSFKGTSAEVLLEMDLTVIGQYYYTNYSNTVAFSFAPLPSGVSYSSASGSFLSDTQPVPEPSSLLLFGTGFLGLTLMLRRMAR